MRLEFDNLAVYAASIGVWKPILIEWVGRFTACDGGFVAHGAWHSWDYEPKDPERAVVQHVIGLPEPERSLETQLRSLRHELEHARQVEEIGAIEFESTYGWELATTHDDYYHLNPYEIEANAVMDEWRDLLPCVKGQT